MRFHPPLRGLRILVLPTIGLLYLIHCHDCVLRGSAEGPVEVRRLQAKYEVVLRDELDLTDPALRDEALGVLLSLPEGCQAVLKTYPAYSRKSRQAWVQIAALTAEANSLPPSAARHAGQQARAEAIDRQIEALRAPIQAEYQILLALAHKAETNPTVIDGLTDAAADALVEMLSVCPPEDQTVVLRALGRLGPRARRLLPQITMILDARGIPFATEAIARIGAE